MFSYSQEKNGGEMEALPSMEKWYSDWVAQQAKGQIDFYKPLLPFDISSDEIWTTDFMTLWQSFAKIVSESPHRSIHDLTKMMIDKSLLNAGEDGGHHDLAQDFVFTVLGWQTMLYKSDYRSCPSTEMCIVDETDGYRGHSSASLKQDRIYLKEPISNFLLGFGLMLPPPGLKATESLTSSTPIVINERVDFRTFNASTMVKIGGIRIEWIDTISCHLEFDRVSKKLFLFRFPAFCLESLRHEATQSIQRTAIYSCASADPGASNWANEQEISKILKEILLSYRLIFGQTKESRRLYRKVSSEKSTSASVQDPLLSELCGRKQLTVKVDLEQQDTYVLSRDFPHLQSRLAPLVLYLQHTKPRTWKEMWLDKRDSSGWRTFWAVLIIGGLGIFLATMQVVLQIIQVVLQAKST